jgi:IclR family transcriptional regulator, KDG regulon repressor
MIPLCCIICITVCVLCTTLLFDIIFDWTFSVAEPNSNTNIIQSLSRGLTALELLANGSMTPKALGMALGIDRSSAYRILCTLAAYGFVERDPLSDQYIISSRKIFAMGSSIGANLHWPTLATPWLRQLRDQTNEAVSLAVLQRDEAIYVAHLPSNEAITIGPLLGVRRPVYCSAVGKAIAAFLPESERQRLMKLVKFTPLTHRTLSTADEFLKELQQVRDVGYAVDDEETFAGVRCIAAPVYDHSGQVVAAMGFSGPSIRLSMDRLRELGPQVHALANEFSASLGAPTMATSPERR